MTDSTSVIDKMDLRDWESVCAIYVEGISTGNATFDAGTPNWESWNVEHLPQCRLVARLDGEILGWAALSLVSGRCIYSGVAEASVYVARKAQGKGIGSALLSALITESEKKGIWTLQAGVFPENSASLALHRRHGFREVGTREKLGKMTFGELAGTWRNVILLERRSNVVGID